MHFFFSVSNASPRRHAKMGTNLFYRRGELAPTVKGEGGLLMGRNLHKPQFNLQNKFTKFFFFLNTSSSAVSVSPKLSIPSSDCFFSKSLKKISNPPRLTELSGRINVSSCWVFCSSLAAGTWDLMKFVTFFAWSSSLLRWSAYHRNSKDQCRDKFCFGKYNLGGWNYVVVSSPTL